LASIIGTLISSTSELKKWSEWACDPDKPKLVTEAFRQYISMGISGALPVDYIISNFSKLQALLDDELCQKFLIRFGDWSKFYGQYFEGENCLKIDPNIVYAIDKIGSEGLQNLFLLVDAHFNGLDREAWLTTLSEESEALKLLFARIKTGYKPLAPYREALMQHILDTLDGNTSISGRHQQWETVLEGVAKNTRQKLAQDVMLDLKNITTNPESVEHFVSVYNEFSRSLPLDSNPDDALDQIITPLVSSKSDPAKAYFQDLEKVMVDCVKKAGSDACGRLQEAVDVLIGSGDEASSGWAIELCEQFGFPRSKLEELVSTDESQEEDENN
jgi:hypothetical protein